MLAFSVGAQAANDKLIELLGTAAFNWCRCHNDVRQGVFSHVVHFGLAVAPASARSMMSIVAARRRQVFVWTYFRSLILVLSRSRMRCLPLKPGVHGMAIRDAVRFRADPAQADSWTSADPNRERWSKISAMKGPKPPSA